jgi:hypothetical protein
LVVQKPIQVRYLQLQLLGGMAPMRDLVQVNQVDQEVGKLVVLEQVLALQDKVTQVNQTPPQLVGGGTVP